MHRGQSYLDGFPGVRQNIFLAINGKKKKLTACEGILPLAKSFGLKQLCSLQGKVDPFRHQMSHGRDQPGGWRPVLHGGRGQAGAVHGSGNDRENVRTGKLNLTVQLRKLRPERGSDTYSVAMAAVANCHRRSAYSRGSALSHGSGAWRLRSGCQQGHVPSRLQGGTHPLPHPASHGSRVLGL